MKRMASIITLLMLAMLALTGCTGQELPDYEADYIYRAGLEDPVPDPDAGIPRENTAWDLEYNGCAIPEWDGGTAWAEINNNEPWFDEIDRQRLDAFENYSELDGLGRCGQAYANICWGLMPDGPRGEIGSVKPSGWHTVRYNDLIDGNYLYNRCHLIGFQLAGENANPKNLITGTRYLNIAGMLDLENAIADHVKDTDGHVLYRVTPVFTGDDLVCKGLVLEAYSVEDAGTAIRTCRFAYNVQPLVEIDYATGDSRRSDGREQSEVEYEMVYGEKKDYIVNISSGKIHLPDCKYVDGMKAENRLELNEALDKLYQSGYTDCGACRPGEQ